MMALHSPGQQNGHIILRLSRACELADAFQDQRDNLVFAAVCVADNQVGQPVLAEHLAVFVLRFGDAVGEEYQQVVRLKIYAALREFREGERSYYCTVYIRRSDRAFANQRLEAGGLR